jgi:hypothetical protein
MSILGKTIRLKGKTMRGKNRVREHGNEWTVLAETEKVLFNPAKGPWLFAAPAGKNQDDKSSRWIHGLTDLDFEVVIPGWHYLI